MPVEKTDPSIQKRHLIRKYQVYMYIILGSIYNYMVFLKIYLLNYIFL